MYMGLIVTLLLLATSSGERTYGEAIVTEVTSIYDGDTFRCNIEGYPAIIGERIPIRIAGIDTPELNDPDSALVALSRRAKQFTVDKLGTSGKVVLKNMRRGSFFRIIADVFVDGENLGQLLIEAGLAKPYDGKTKSEWGRD